jgi:hypothetical protein
MPLRHVLSMNKNKHVISTGAGNSLIVPCAVERPLYLPFARTQHAARWARVRSNP